MQNTAKKSRSITNNNRLIAFSVSATIWVLSVLLAFLSLFILLSIGKSIDYSPSAFGLFSGSILAFIGVILAILIGVFTSINGHNRDNRNTGFQKLRQATSNLENLNIQLKNQGLAYVDELNSKAANLILPVGVRTPGVINPDENIILLNAWIQDIDCLTYRLNSITMNWSGWDSNPGLESDLHDHVIFSQVISANLENEVQAILTEFQQNMRDILFGLRRLDEAAVGDTLLLRIGVILGSLTVLIAFGIGFRLASDLDIGLFYTSSVIFFDAAFLGINILLHLAALMFFIFRWWDNVRKRDKIWMS